MRFFVILLLTLLPYSLSAENSEWFVGVDAGLTGDYLSEQAEDYDTSYGPEFGLKVGLRDKNSRMYIGVTSANDIDGKVSSTLNPYIALEGISNEFDVISKSTAKFFFGARFGASIADIYSEATDTDTTSTTAALAGLQGGLVFLLPADFEIELAYRHYWTFRDDATDFSLGTVYTALNYKFGAF